jgi:DNA-binding NarL/FixJ family response regulator
MKKVIILSGLAMALFFSLVALEAIENWPDVAIEDLLFDVIEIGLLAGAVVATAYFSFEMKEMRHEHSTLLGDFVRARADGDRWRETARAHIEGLQNAIGEQFEGWRLTPSESDIAMLMLKGLSHKEIARLRNSSEATVRQQATAIYGKSGLTSRAELSAFFFEDLLVAARSG